MYEMLQISKLLKMVLILPKIKVQMYKRIFADYREKLSLKLHGDFRQINKTHLPNNEQ